jgi:photosystem II stability/assembly factor-like uncharacterized protein
VFPIFGLTIDRRNPRILYAAGYHYTNGGHVYRTANGGRSWADITGEMDTHETPALALSSDGRILYAGTGGEAGGGGVLTTGVSR